MKSTIASKSSVERDGAGRNTAETNGPASPALGKPAAENQVPTSGAATTNRHARAKWQVVNGSAGDHALIHQFLISIFHQPSASEFQAQLDEPRYEPSDRLLTKVDGQIAGHVRLLHREMRFGDLVVPVGIVADLATLPKYRQHGCATALLSAARKTLFAVALYWL